jgi:hypothetical protein
MADAKMLSPAGVDLGLDLQNDVEDEEERNRRLMMQKNSPGAFGDPGLMSPMSTAAVFLGLGVK